jgi:hypothetical protein
VFTISADICGDVERGSFATEVGVGIDVVPKTPLTAFGRASADPGCRSVILPSKDVTTHTRMRLFLRFQISTLRRISSPLLLCLCPGCTGIVRTSSGPPFRGSIFFVPGGTCRIEIRVYWQFPRYG